MTREQERHLQADDLALQPDPHAGPVLPPCFQYVSAFIVGSRISPVQANGFLLAGFGADVDSFVVDTDYEEYAVMLQLSRDQRSGEESTNILLYSEFRSSSGKQDHL